MYCTLCIVSRPVLDMYVYISIHVSTHVYIYIYTYPYVYIYTHKDYWAMMLEVTQALNYRLHSA